MTSSTSTGQDDSPQEKYSTLEKFAKAHRGRWRMQLMLQQCKEMQQDGAVQQEAFVAVLGMSSDKITAGHQMLFGLPEPLLTFSLALCTCRRGTGGRGKGSDPKSNPQADPLKAEYVLKKRQSAGLSKFKQKVSTLVAAATEAGLFGRSAADLGLEATQPSPYLAGSTPNLYPNNSFEQQQIPQQFQHTGQMDGSFYGATAAMQQQQQQQQQEHGQAQQERVFLGGCAGTAAATEDVWAQFGAAGARDAAQQYGSGAAGFQGYAASGSSPGSALFLGQGFGSDYNPGAAAAPAPAAGGAHQRQMPQQQPQKQQHDLTWLLEDMEVPSSPTLTALLQIDSPLSPLHAGGPCILQLPPAGSPQPPPAATGAGGHLGPTAACGNTGAAPSALSAGCSSWQAPWLSEVGALAGQPSQASVQQQIAAGGQQAVGSTSTTSTMPPMRLPSPFLQPQVQLQQLAEQGPQDQDRRRQLLLQLLRPATSAPAHSMQGAAAAAGEGPDAVAVATDAAINALLNMGGNGSSSSTGTQGGGHLLSVHRPLERSSTPGSTAAYPTVNRQHSWPLGGPQDVPTNLPSVQGAASAGLHPAAPAYSTQGREFEGSQGSSWDAAAAYAARVAAHARGSGGLALNVAVAAAASAGTQEAQAGPAAPGAAHPAPQMVNPQQAARQQGGAAAAGQTHPPAQFAAMVPIPGAVAGPAGVAAAAPAPANQVSPMVQALLQQLDFLLQHNAPNALGAALQGFFPLMTAAAGSGHNIRPVLSRTYLLMMDAAAMQVRQLQGLMQQLTAMGGAEDLDRGMQLILPMAAFPGLAAFAAQALADSAAAPAPAVAAAANGAGAQMVPMLQQLQQQAGAANGAGVQWFTDVVGQLGRVG